MAQAQDDLQADLEAIAMMESEAEHKENTEMGEALEASRATAEADLQRRFQEALATERERIRQESASAEMISRLRAAEEAENRRATELLLQAEQDAEVAFTFMQNMHTHEDIKGDAALARFLEENDEQPAHPNYQAHSLANSLNSEQATLARHQLTPILAHASVKGTPGVALPDAHTHTRTFIRANLPTLRAMDDLLRPVNPTMLPAQILAELQQRCQISEPDLLKIQQTMNLLNRFLALGNPVEASETNANVPELLSRTWTLAKQFGSQEAPATTQAMASILSDNIGDGGGCMAGLVARLFAFYANMLNYIVPTAPAPKPAGPGK